MDLRQLRYFLAIANEGQITRAARALNIEQPPLSRQLKMMEQELNVTLFDRSGQGLKLTQAGELLRQKAESLLQQFDETVQEVKALNEGISGRLAIGSVVSCISLLPPRIETFLAEFPGVTFKISEGDHFLLSEQLERRNIELIIARLPFEAASENRNYAIHPLPSDPFVVVVPSSWSLAATHDEIQMKDLADLPLLTLKTDETTGMHNRVVNECRRHGFEPKVICECSSVAIIIALVAAGIGATVFPKSVMASFPSPVIRMLPITDLLLQSDVGIVWLQERYLSKLAQRFIAHFVE